ncbi:TM2 domain-containing protein [Mycobacterium sp. AT1]|uniref:TM2 domain-containing protein n=1 Tax=Mycobacterium sp. AT1 TaxID=1961706 RepID=UPI0009AC4041|nr:TM2 domain-containing protein [Mycobacterium sp. AT1]
MSVPPPPPPPDSNPPYPPPPYGSDPSFPPPVGDYGGYPPPPPYGAQYGGYPPPPYPGQFGVDPWGRPLSDKSKMVAGLLQIFLGTFGIGRFYLGYNGIAVAQLAVSLLTCGIGAIWPFVDGILILLGKVQDPSGRPLRE